MFLRVLRDYVVVFVQRVAVEVFERRKKEREREKMTEEAVSSSRGEHRSTVLVGPVLLLRGG